VSPVQHSFFKAADC